MGKKAIQTESVQNERQPRNSAQVRPDQLDETDRQLVHNAATVSATHPAFNPSSHHRFMAGMMTGENNNKTEIDDDLLDENIDVTSVDHDPRGQVTLSAYPDGATIYPSGQETIYECSARLLFMAVKWSKSLPSFANLPFRDQVSWDTNLRRHLL
ncbi:hypothetical protein LSH36_63g07009 [Paralvinella palmiformis]|uniref:Uncharacterized protein n=1 Tax=Paralvinella palmiformis TaxID=53620 RepID=A0AAD9K4Z3_9ANNE|nr:hypothetical protein LSH36_63g07009 [Paralvinella palmiformis]